MRNIVGQKAGTLTEVEDDVSGRLIDILRRDGSRTCYFKMSGILSSDADAFPNHPTVLLSSMSFFP